jgi:hypothetical protein
MQVLRWGGWVGAGCLVVLAFWSCRETPPSSFDSNIPPETAITGAPAESSQSYYRIHLKWYGSDKDGSIDHYEYAVTDTDKTPGETTPGFSGYASTTRTDSVFVFTANLPQILGHRFYVRAVDNEGKADPTPAVAYFLAEDFNTPRITFLQGIGSWYDRDGHLRTTAIHSTNRFAPTDTIGVGGSVTVSWTGFDVDPGDSVVGFEYRLATSPLYTGGTLADTVGTVSFARPPGSTIASNFTGAQAFLVRGIDVAKAKTNPDAVRSFVVNFDPVAWIVDPNQTDPPAHKKVFTDIPSGVVWPTGTWLADGLREIQFKYTGFDDPRDVSLDPNNPSGVKGFRYRITNGGNGLAYQDAPGNPRPFPQVNDFVVASPALGSGDYDIFIQATDELGRNGKPDTVRVRVNYFSYFESVNYVDSLGVEQQLWVPSLPGSPADTVSLVLHQEPGGGYPDLVVRTLARDDHHPPPGKHPLDFNPVVEEELHQVTDYSLRLNSSRDGFVPQPHDSLGVPIPLQRSFAVDPQGGAGFLHAGVNRLELRSKDDGQRVTTLEVLFRLSLE